MGYDYLQAIESDIVEYIECENKYLKKYKCGDREALVEELHDTLWTNDSVTGNGSGSYTFNSAEAKEYVLDNIERVQDMVLDFGVEAITLKEKFLHSDWEWFDVSIRCSLLGQAIGAVLDKHPEYYESDEAEEEE